VISASLRSTHMPLLWAPTLFVIILTAVALVLAGSAPVARSSQRLWLASIMFSGLVALAGSVWQGVQLTGTTVPPSAPGSGETEASRTQLARRVETLQNRIKELEEGGHGRAISADAAEKLADYLRRFGGRRVVVSCVADDLEAYNYANQLVNVLRAAGWDAEGPEVTEIFGDVKAVGVNLYVNGNYQSDTAKILLDGFAKFNIPYQSRITPSQAIPDIETVELYVAAMPSAVMRTGSE
jgi:hypothetical protein